MLKKEKRLSIRKRAPSASSHVARKVMQANVGRETSMEKLLRNSLERTRFTFQSNSRPEHDLKIRADFVFCRRKLCVFLDGCYWHGCRRHYKPPITNREWWDEKISDNKRRDRRQTKELRSRGWVVFRFWEHEVTSVNVLRITSQIVKRLRELPCKKLR